MNMRGRDGEVTPRLRLSVLGMVSVALFAALFARLYDLQIVEASSYEVQAEANRVREVTIPAPRGRILDRNGVVLVDNRVAVQVTVERNDFNQLSEDEQKVLLERLAAELIRAGRPITAEQIHNRIFDERFSRYAPVPVAQDIPEDLKIFFEEHIDEFPSVSVQRTTVREYPYGPLGANVLGYVGKINENELAFTSNEREKRYSLNDDIGKSGVEQSYEKALRGQPGLREIEVDAEGNPVRVIKEQPPVPGDDLVLSLDINVQFLAQQRLEQGLAEARERPAREGNEQNQGSTGAVVVEDPNNGQILAMASYPTYDPTPFVDGIDAQEWAYLMDPANNYPLNNWAIQGQWAPGSTYKLFGAYAALASGLMSPSTVFYDSGGYQIPGCSGAKCYRTNAGGASYGSITIDEAITVSSDAFFYNVGAQFWLQRDRFGGDSSMQQYVNQFGLGNKTGVPLAHEAGGRTPTPQWKVDYCGGVEGCDDVWRTGDNVNMGIGQGDVLVTPLQLANGYATFANGGTLFQPQVALRSEASNGGTTEVAPVPMGQINMPEEIRGPIWDGLVGVPSHGTAASAFAGFDLESFPVGGKTGTAQVDGKADTSVFAAFGPATSPQFTIAVFMSESGFGSQSAAPVTRAMFDALSGAVPLEPAPLGGDTSTPTGELAEVGGAYD